MIAAALQMMVKAGTMTSSPGPTPAQATAECRVDVPEFTEMAYFTPNFSAKARSKRVFIRPCRLLRTPRSITSAMYLRSLPVNRQACGDALLGMTAHALQTHRFRFANLCHVALLFSQSSLRFCPVSTLNCLSARRGASPGFFA